jgi:hypothetical protein
VPGLFGYNRILLFFTPSKNPEPPRDSGPSSGYNRISKNLQAHELLGGAASVLLDPQGVHALG